MPILALAESVSRQLRSAQAIPSPVVIVKELLDNAIDSGATSVDVLISPNVLDRIEVRDNGHGIHCEDFDALGRTSHTSKLASLDDLKTSAATTLGFRGMALASINTFATVILVTRTLHDPVASRIQLVRGRGGVAHKESTPAPVGTSVLVSDLFQGFPVRRQEALKSVAKAHTRIKDLLRAYILARPCLRLSFNVMKSPRLSWSYSPGPNPDVKVAALQVVGPGVVSQCTQSAISLVSPDCTPQPLTNTDTGPFYFKLDAIITKCDVDPSHAPKGAFISVDSRPLSSSKGIAKKLYRIIKEHLNGICRTSEPVAIFKDPFILINIKCAPGSYDPNIEPAKDDVLFAREQQLVRGVKALALEVYGKIESGRDKRMPRGIPDPTYSGNRWSPFDASRMALVFDKTTSAHKPPVNPSFEPTETTMLKGASPLVPGSSAAERDEPFVAANASPTSRQMTAMTNRGWAVDMSRSSHGEETPNEWYPKTRHSAKEAVYNNVPHVDHEGPNAINPWILAKLNTSRRDHPRAACSPRLQAQQLATASGVALPCLHMNGSVTELSADSGLTKPVLDVEGCRLGSEDVSDTVAPRRRQASPYTSSSEGLSGTKRRSRAQSRREFRGDAINCEELAPRRSTNYGGHQLDTHWDVPLQARCIRTLGLDETRLGFEGTLPTWNARKSQSKASQLVSATQQLQNNSPPDHTVVHRVSRFADENESAGARLPVSRLKPNSQTSDSQVYPSPTNESRLRPSTSSCWTESAERAAYPTVMAGSSTTALGTHLSDDDARASMKKRQHSLSARTRKSSHRPRRRLKSIRLPLEFTVAGFETFHIRETLPTGLEGVMALLEDMVEFDAYVVDGTMGGGLNMTVSEATQLEKRIGTFFVAQDIKMADGRRSAGVGIKIDLLGPIKGKTREVLAGSEGTGL